MPRTTKSAPTTASAVSASARHASFDDLPNDGYVRLKQLLPAVVPFSPATFWRRVADGSFPAPTKLGERVTAWRVRDVRKWLEAQCSK